MPSTRKAKPPPSQHPKKKTNGDPKDLEEVLAALDGARENGHGKMISVGELMDGIGRRTFGPLLIIPALLVMTPAGAIPGLPTAMAVVVLAIAGQLFIGMDHFWIPKFIEERKIERKKLEKAICWVTPAARFVDKFLRPRLTYFTREPFLHVLLGLCVLSALIVPLLEFVPLAAILPNAAIVMFGLAIIAHDGLLAIAATMLTAAAAGLIFSAF